MKKSSQAYFDDLYSRYILPNSCKESIEKAFHIIYDAFSKNKVLVACGNGGSASDAEHLVGEFMNKFKIVRPISDKVKNAIREKSYPNGDYLISKLQEALPAISLVSQTSLTTAISNDIGPDMIFAQQVFGYAQDGAVLAAFSTSGNSPNVVNAVRVANAVSMKTIGFTGENESTLSRECTVCICAPSTTTYKVQEFHLAIYHSLCAAIEEEFFGN